MRNAVLQTQLNWAERRPETYQAKTPSARALMGFFREMVGAAQGSRELEVSGVRRVLGWMAPWHLSPSCSPPPHLVPRLFPS